MDLFFSSDALKRKNRKRKKNEDEDDDLLLRELERDVEVDSTRCEECGGTSFTEDESGRLTCNNCGLLNEQQLTQSQVITTFDAKLVGRQAGSGHAVHTKGSKALGDAQKYHRPPKITPQVCLEAMQWMMKKQASELIKTMSCDKGITQRLRLFWFRFLDCLLSSCSNKVEERRRLFRFFKISKMSSSISTSSSSEEEKEEEEQDEKETQSRSRKTWSMHGFRTSLYLLYLACRDMSEPVLLSDIFRACCRGKITYVAAYHSFPLSLRWRCIGALDFFCPSSSKYGFFQYLEYEWKQCMILRDALVVDKSSLLYRGCTNWGLSVIRLAHVVGLDDEEKRRCVHLWYSNMSIVRGTQMTRKHITQTVPDIHLGAILVVAVKLGGKRWYEKWRERLEVRKSSSSNKELKSYARNCEKRFLRKRTTISHDHKLALAAIGLEKKSTKALRKRLNKEVENTWCSKEAKQIGKLLRSVCLDTEEEEEEEGEEEERKEEEEEKVPNDNDTYVTYRPLIPCACNLVNGNMSPAKPDDTLPFAPYYSRLVRRISETLNCSHVNILREIQRIEGRVFV